MVDIIVIGAGIIGSTVVYELSKYDKKIMVIDKEKNAGLAVSGHNSAIVHNASDPEPNTLKAKYNVMGSKMYEEYAKELETPYKQIGAFIIAHSKEDSTHIDVLVKNAKNRDVFVERLTKQEAIALEPNLSDDIVEVLHMPTTAIIDPIHLSQQAIKKAKANGVDVHFDEAVQAIKKSENGFELTTNKGVYQTKVIVNAAGLYAPHIEQMVSEPTFSLVMIRGDYIELSEKADGIVSRVLYPVPTPISKGVLVVPMMNHHVLVGPTAITVFDPTDDQPTKAGLNEVKEKVKEIVKHIPYEHEVRRFGGIRPKEEKNDFIIAENKHVPYFFSLAGIDSPGISSAPAIATDFVHRILKERLKF
jgi:glycerol-3-phosphate dehydrogenase